MKPCDKLVCIQIPLMGVIIFKVKLIIPTIGMCMQVAYHTVLLLLLLLLLLLTTFNYLLLLLQ